MKCSVTEASTLSKLVLPVGTVETAVAAILRRSGVAAVVVVEAGLALHEAFKGAVAAGSEIHGVASFLNLGAKKAADFFKICGWAYEKRTPLARCPFSSTIQFFVFPHSISMTTETVI